MTGHAEQSIQPFGLNLSGKVVMMLANSALMLMLGGWLMSNESYGLFATAVGAQLLGSRVVLLGADQGVIRLFTLPVWRDEQPRVLFSGVVSSLLIACVFLPLAFLFARGALAGAPIAVAWSIPLGALGIALFDYGVCARLAELRYRESAVVQATMPVIRLVVALLAFVMWPDDPSVVLIAYAGCAAIFGLALGAQLWRQSEGWPSRALVRQLLSYSKWVGVADIGVMASIQQGLFLLTFLGFHDDAGVYGFCLFAALAFFSVLLAFYHTLLPRAARLSGIAELPRFLLRSTAAALGLGLVCAVAAGFVGTLLPWILAHLKPELVGFAKPFYLLSGFSILMILEVPFTAACHAMLRPGLVTVGLGVRVAAIAACGWWLVPGGGVLEAAQAQLLGGAIGFAVFVTLVTLSIRRALLSVTRSD